MSHYITKKFPGLPVWVAAILIAVFLTGCQSGDSQGYHPASADTHKHSCAVRKAQVQSTAATMTAMYGKEVGAVSLASGMKTLARNGCY